VTSGKTVPSGEVVVDATLLIDIVRRRDPGTKYLGVLRRATVTSINFGETLYKLASFSTAPAKTIEAALVATGLSVADVDLGVTQRFVDLKAIDQKSVAAQGRSGAQRISSLSLSDMVCLGYALEHDLPVLSADVHWTTLPRHGLTVEVFDYRDPATTL
jgi:PIN domain nuclease of toxin-antitoxin system